MGRARDIANIINSGAFLTPASASATYATNTGMKKVVQVVFGSTSTQVNTNSSSFQDTTLSATITPTSSSNKILVLLNQNGISKTSGNTGNGVWLRLLRNSDQIALFAAYQNFTGTAINLTSAASLNYLDSPNTTSSLIYKTQYRNNVAATDVYAQDGNVLSTIVLMEVTP
jgi:hypothetical protein